jgi:plastocyanin
MLAIRRLSLVIPTATALAALLLGQNPPAPTVDRVGFPANYQTTMKILYVYDRPDNKSVRTIYANDPVFHVDTSTQNNYPYGSIIVMETWRALQDAQGAPIFDAQGRFQKDPAATPTLFVMRKEKGFGVDYGPNRNGEWEYVAYHPDGTYQTSPQNSFSCAQCHLQATQWKDWVFRAGLYFDGASGSGAGAVPAAAITSYQFVPGSLHAKAGSTIIFYNEDVIAHQIVDDDPGGWKGPVIKAGGNVALRFPTVPFQWQWNFHCAIHPSMKGTIIVDPQ